MALVADPMVPARWRIERLRRETRDVFTLELTPVNGGSGRSFSAGQFNMLYVFGAGEVPISISGDPARHERLVHTVRAVGAVTNAIGGLKRGDVVGVRGPFGSHWPVAEAVGNDVVIVAGGIGLASLRPAIYQVLASRHQYGRVVLLYGARTSQDLIYRPELGKWGSRSRLNVEVTLDAATSKWRGHVGVVTALIPRAPFDPLDSVAMICGPEVMMRFTVIQLRKRGLSPKQIFISMERNMKCAVGFCGHCQYGPTFICKDGPIFRYDRIEPFFRLREV